MGSGQEPSPALKEFKQFLEFLQSLWAMLAGVSVVFPLSNTLVQIIPLAQWTDGGFAYLSPPVVTGVTTLACLFIILWTFGKREEMRSHRTWDSLPRQAGRSFVLGIAGLAVYLVGHYTVKEDFYFRVLGWGSDDLRRIGGDLVLLMAYGGFFALVTRAFLLLGLREYLRERVEAS